MSYWQEASCEKAATEIGWHLIYVTGQNFGYPGFRAKSGDLMEVFEDRDLFEGGDFYRVRLRPAGTLTRNNKIWAFSPDVTRYSNWDFAFQVTVRHDKKEVCFGPTGQIKVPGSRYKGRSLGSYGMSMVIRWVRSHYPEYSVARGRLSYVDASEDDARDRRNAFYRNLGFTLEFPDDAEERDGSFVAASVKVLNEHWRRGKVRRVGRLRELLYGLCVWRQDMETLKTRLSNVHSSRVEAERWVRLYRGGFLLASLAATSALWLLWSA